ncbi:histidine phosphatase superfamily [Xylogone sp. PMI_703]|nr:histidine phosphatase superfamily [Xylogone sp. PMI_703]
MFWKNVIPTAVALAGVAQAVLPRGSSPEYINYTTLTGLFLQDDPATDPSTFDYTAHNFGLIDQAYSTDDASMVGKTQWQRFANYVFRLNRESGRFVQYKVIWFGRHGEGYHNAAESYYGTPAWNCYWSIRDGNATVTWADAHIDAAGVAQAQVAANFWAQQIKEQKIHTPDSYYTSPLTRCLETANITFGALDLPDRHPFIPTVKELLREGISGHTCDRRSNKTYIHDNFPTYEIEAGFSEQDLLWKPLVGETSVDQDIRSKKVLDDIFSTDSNTWVSITSHSGEIGSMLRVLGHRSFSLVTGAVIPVLIKAETIKGTAAPTATQPYTPISTCSTQPPLPTAT